MESTKRPNFYVSSGIFAVLSLAAAGLNYLLYPTLAHILDAKSFGNFTVIVALSNQILAILLAFNIISISLVKNNPEAVARDQAQAIQKILIWFFLVVSAAVLALSPIIKSQLKVDSPLSFFILALILLSCVPAAIWTGYLQGHKRLTKVGMYSFSGALSKFVLALVLGLSFGAVGALWGVVAGSVLGLVVLWKYSGMHLPRLSSALVSLKPSEKTLVRQLRPLIVQSILIVGGLGILQNIDIIFAKAFFNPTIAGQYSGISILSNSIYYVAFLLVWIILPEIDPAQPSQNRRVLGSAYKLLGLMTAAVVVVEIVFKQSITETLLGNNFADLGQVLIYATLFQTTLVAVALYAFYLLVVRNRRGLWLAACVILPCLIVPWLYHSTTLAMIRSLWMATLLGVVFYFIINVIDKRLRYHDKS